MRLNKPSELSFLPNDSHVYERSFWNESPTKTPCFHTPSSLDKIPPQFHSKLSSWGWPKKLQDDSIAHYKSYTSRAELASVLDNERKFFDCRAEPVKPPRKTRSPKAPNINQNPNINCVPSDIEKYPHDKLSWVINRNMTTGDPYQKSFYDKPKYEAPIQQSNFNFQRQVNSLTDSFVKHVNLNESAQNLINGNESAQILINRNESMTDLVKRNESAQNLINRNESSQNLINSNESAQILTDSNEFTQDLVKSPQILINKNEFKEDLVRRNESAQNLINRNESARIMMNSNGSVQDLANRSKSAQMVNRNESAHVLINGNESRQDLVRRDESVQNLTNKNESTQDLLNRNWSSGVNEDTISRTSISGKRRDVDARVDNELKEFGFRDANRFSEKERSAGGRTESYRAYLARKQEKTDINNSVKLSSSLSQNRYSEKAVAPKTRPEMVSRRAARKKRCSESLSGFDVYNIETALPQIDLDAIETHLRAAREEERRRRNDREEIRRRLATGDADEFSTNERPGKKPSLQSRLQSGMNLQICFMNETMSDTESPSSDQDSPAKTASSKTSSKSESTESPPKPLAAKPVRPLFNNKTQPVPQETMQTEPDFFAQQAKLQADARQALAEAKETARRQMEIERQRMTTSPITDMLRASLTKVGVPFPEERRRLSRQLLTNMNVAQLQVIVNDLHTQIEILNEDLVKFLMERDELHMGQDSMLVDIEDLTRYLGAKEKSLKDDLRQNNNLDTVKLLSPMPIKPKQTRTTPLSMIKK